MGRRSPLASALLRTTMTISSNSENYPGCDYSLSQLLYATKRRLQDTVLGGRYVQCCNCGMLDFETRPHRIATTTNHDEVSRGGGRSADCARCLTMSFFR